MIRIRTVLARSFVVGAIAVAGAMSGPQAALAEDEVTCNLGDPVGSCVMPWVEFVGTSEPQCSPDTGKCCSHNPADPKGLCSAQPPTCEVDPSLCPPPGESVEP